MTPPCPQPPSAFFPLDKEQEQGRATLGRYATPGHEAILQAKESPQNKFILCNKALGCRPAQGLQDPNCCPGTSETEKEETSSGSLGKDL